MGKTNLAINQLLERKPIFADFINGTVFQGEQFLHPEDLELLSTQYGVFYDDETGKTHTLERYGDIRMKAETGTYSIVFANETQAKVHYAMPVRNMLYDALEYMKQVQNLEKEHKEAGDTLDSAAFLSGITKEDRLTPVINTVFYTGTDWDGKKSLYEMMDLEEDSPLAQIWKEYLPNYKINIICADEIEDPQVFQSSLQQIFTMLKYRNRKKELYRYVNDHKEDLKRMDNVELTAALTLIGEQKRLLKIIREQKKEESEVCKAIDDLIEDGREEGRKEGESKGQERINELNRRLLADNRHADLVKSVEDSAYQKTLLQEYGLV